METKEQHVWTPENLILLRTSFEFSKQQVLAELGKINPADAANDIYERAKPDLDETAEGLLNAIATGTAERYINTVEAGTVSKETRLMFCRLCLENTEDILKKIHTTE